MLNLYVGLNPRRRAQSCAQRAAAGGRAGMRAQVWAGPSFTKIKTDHRRGGLLTNGRYNWRRLKG